MTSAPRIVVGFAIALGLGATSALAQAKATPPGPIPVSPGETRKAPLVSSCPTFTWAPTTTAQSYDLAVYVLERPGQLAPLPALATAVPGRAAAWTPSAAQCLTAGSRYVWFMRDVGPTGAGDWSQGLAFTVADVPSVAAGESTNEAVKAGAAASAQKPENPGPPEVKPPPNTHDEILTALDTVNTKLDSLLDPVSRQICFELAGNVEVGVQYGGSIDGEFEGRVGAEGFGNGVMGKIKAPSSLGFAAAAKGVGTPKYAICRAVGPLFNAGLTQGQLRMAAAMSSPTPLTDEDVTTRLLALAEQLQMNDEKVSAALELLPTFSGAPDLWSALRPQSVLTDLASIMPLPNGVRTALQDPAQIVANFKNQIMLCSQGNLPPVIADLVSEFCGLAAAEPFKKLLNRVDLAVSNVQTTVNTVKGKIDDIISQLPVSGDCKFFCK